MNRLPNVIPFGTLLPPRRYEMKIILPEEAHQKALIPSDPGAIPDAITPPPPFVFWLLIVEYCHNTEPSGGLPSRSITQL